MVIDNADVQSLQPLYSIKDVSDYKVRAVTKLRSWHCKIGRRHEDVKDSDIVDNFQEHGIKAIKGVWLE